MPDMLTTPFHSRQWAVEAFVSRQDTNNALQGHPKGHFIVRFSETRNGCLVVSYQNDADVHHVLLTDKDLRDCQRPDCTPQHQELVCLHENVPLRQVFANRAEVPPYFSNNFLIRL